MASLTDADYNALHQKLKEALDNRDKETASKIGDYINSQETASGPESYGSPVNSFKGPVGRIGASLPFEVRYGKTRQQSDIESRGASPSEDTSGDVTASFSPNKASRIPVYEKALTQQFGKPVKVTVDVNTGYLTYKNPNTGKTQYISDNLKQHVGTAIPEAGQALATTKLGYLPGVAATALGEAARLEIGHALGADEGANVEETSPGVIGTRPYSQGQIAMDAGKAGVGAAIAGGPIVVGQRAPSLFTWFLKGQRPWSPKVAGEMLDDAASAQSAVDKVRELGGSAFTPTIPQMANNRGGLKLQQSVLNNSKMGGPLAETLQNNEGELAKAFQGAGDEAGMYPWEPVQGGPGQSMIDKIKAMKDQRINTAKANVQGSENQLKDLFDSLPTETKYKVWRDVSPELKKPFDEFDRQEKDAWLKVSQVMEGTPSIPREFWATGKGAEMRSAIQDLRAKQRGALTEGQKGQFKGIIPNLPNPNPTPDEKLLESLGMEMDQGGIRTVPQINDYIQFLRRIMRGKGKTGFAYPPDMAVIKKMEEDAVAARADWLGKNDPELLNSIETAEDAGTKKGQFIRDMVNKGFMKKTKGQSGVELAQPGLLATILSREDQGLAQDLFDAVKDNPKAKDLLNNFSLSYIKDTFRKDFNGDVRVTAAALDKLMNKKLGVLRIWSPDAEKTLLEGSDYAQAVNDYSQKLKLTEQAFNKSFAGRIDSFNGEKVSNALFDDPKNFGVQDMGKLKKLAQGMGTFEDMQSKAYNKLREIVTGPQGDKFDGDALNKIMNDSEQVAKLRVWFPRDYVNNLKTLADGFNMSTRTYEGAAALPSERNRFTDLARLVYAHPLTAESRALTFMTGLRKDAFARGANKGLTDPEYLKKLIMWSKVDAKAKESARLAAALNMSDLSQDFYGDVGQKQSKEQ